MNGLEPFSHFLLPASCRVCYQLKWFSLSLSFTPNLQSGISPSLSFSWLRLSWSTRQHGHDMQSSWNIWMRSFETYAKWSVQARTDTYFRKAVTLVWDSLRLAPNMILQERILLWLDAEQKKNLAVPRWSVAWATSALLLRHNNI